MSVLEANAKLVQKGEYWTWNQWLWEARVLFPLRVTFYQTQYWHFRIVGEKLESNYKMAWLDLSEPTQGPDRGDQRNRLHVN